MKTKTNKEMSQKRKREGRFLNYLWKGKWREGRRGFSRYHRLFQKLGVRHICLFGTFWPNGEEKSTGNRKSRSLLVKRSRAECFATRYSNPFLEKNYRSTPMLSPRLDAAVLNLPLPFCPLQKAVRKRKGETH